MRIDQVIKQLEVWGRFWADKKQGEGYASTSMTQQLCEMMRTQVYSPGTSHQTKHLAESIHVPEHINEIDVAMTELSAAQRMHIKLKYINNKRIDNAYTRSGERKLSALI